MTIDTVITPRRGALVLLLALTTAAPACRKQAEPPPPPSAASPVKAEPPVAAVAEADRVPMQERTQELEEGTRQRARAVADQRADLRRARAGFDADVEELTPEQRQLLEDRISKEKGSRKSLLQEILNQDVQIRTLRTRLESIATQVPASHVAAHGDRHDRIAMDFLLSKGVPAEKAYELISKLNLEDALVPGFRVWTYYDNGQFGTWVTQGTATISPAERQRRLREEVETLRAEQNALMGQYSTLKKSAEDLQRRADAGEADARAALSAAEAAAAAARASAEALSNVVHYGIGTKKALEAAKVIDGKLSLKNLDIPEVQSLNLAAQQSIVFEPASYDPKIKKVKRVRVAPASFLEGQDYSVTTVGDVGIELRVLNPDKFLRAGKFVVVIE
jgi:hypothetical protein